VSRRGHHWRARRAREQGPEREGSNAGRRQERSGWADVGIRPHRAPSRCSPTGVRKPPRRGTKTQGGGPRTTRWWEHPRVLHRRPMARPSGAAVRQDVQGRVPPASSYHVLRPMCGRARGHKGGAIWVTVPIAIAALRRDAARTAALATRLSARRPPPPPGRGDGLASAAGFRRRPRNRRPSAIAQRGSAPGARRLGRGRPDVAERRTRAWRTAGRAFRRAKARASRRTRQRIRGRPEPEDKEGSGRHPANEMKPPTTVPYAMWAATLTSGVCGP
jgi:hypothetical protein